MLFGYLMLPPLVKFCKSLCKVKGISLLNKYQSLLKFQLWMIEILLNEKGSIWKPRVLDSILNLYTKALYIRTI